VVEVEIMDLQELVVVLAAAVEKVVVQPVQVQEDKEILEDQVTEAMVAAEAEVVKAQRVRLVVLGDKAALVVIIQHLHQQLQVV
jgi:hypothetical protein